MLRVLDEVERVMKEMKAEGVKPSMAIYNKRSDLPAQIANDSQY
jgi:hypothetical protein